MLLKKFIKIMFGLSLFFFLLNLAYSVYGQHRTWFLWLAAISFIECAAFTGCLIWAKEVPGNNNDHESD